MRIAVALASLLVAASCAAQIKGELRVADSNEVQVVELNDGTSLRGRIVDVRETTVQFESKMCEVELLIADIVAVRTVMKSSIREGQIWFENPHATRLLISPTAYTLKSGEGYFQSTYIFFAGGAVGMTDNISLAAGLSLFPGAENQLFYIAPKVGLPISDKVQLAFGGAWMSVTGASSSFGSLYGVATVGSRDQNFTVGVNQGFGDGEFADAPVCVLGYQGRFTRRVALVSENYWAPKEENGILSFGFRFFNESLAADLGFWRPIDAEFEGFPFIPYVDFVVTF